jgi:DNA-binding response OmpR family regulator
VREERALAGARILILEDEYLIAADLRDELAAHGATVLGPFRQADMALEAIACERPSLALVDVNLGLGPSFDVPRALRTADVPFLFVTGYDRRAIPPEFADVPLIGKPVGVALLVHAATALLARTAQAPASPAR